MFNSKPGPGSGPFIVQEVIAQSASCSAGTVYAITNPGFHRGMQVYWTIHSFPGSASSTANIGFFGTDPLGNLFSINTPGTARSATGTTGYMMYPGITVVGNNNLNVIMPNKVTITISLSSGATSKETTFSLFVEWIP